MRKFNGIILFFIIANCIILTNHTAYGATLKSKSYLYQTGNQPGEKNRIYKRHISRGDSLLEKKQYQLAMTEFQKASELMPYEEYPRLQMQKIETILGVQQLEEKKKQDEVVDKPNETETKEPEINQPVDISQPVNDSIKKSALEKYASVLETIEKTDDAEKNRNFLHKRPMN
ncbi:MAG: hypothetical protein HC906_17275 [Bacteroidales bacterium]|nr:hypothetical protein [Bacteroidales bacterium]